VLVSAPPGSALRMIAASASDSADPVGEGNVVVVDTAVAE
jgi:hypothetical protein